MDKNIEISVTSLYSVLGCPLCFWLDQKGLGAPEFPLPGILNRMDKVTKKFMEKFIGNSNLPKWFPVHGTFLGPTKTLKATDPKSGITRGGGPHEREGPVRDNARSRGRETGPDPARPLSGEEDTQDGVPATARQGLRDVQLAEGGRGNFIGVIFSRGMVKSWVGYS